MKAIEVTGRIDAEGNLLLDEPIQAVAFSRVRVILLFSEPDEETDDPDDAPVEVVKASLQRALQQAKSGDRIPLSEMWDGIDKVCAERETDGRNDAILTLIATLNAAIACMVHPVDVIA